MPVISFYVFGVSILIVVVMIFTEKKNYLGTVGAGVVLLGTVMVFTFVVIPEELGYGRVPNKPESFAKRLDVGKKYELLASYQVGDDAILLVRESGYERYYAIRVKSGQVPRLEPRYDFTLINGVPVEVK